MARIGRPRAGDFSDPDTGGFTEEGLNLIRRAAGLGLRHAGIAALIGIEGSTFSRRLSNDPDAKEAYMLGKAEADLQVSNALFQRAINGDMAAIRWYEMTRTDRNPNVPVVEGDGSASVIEVPATLPEDEWKARFSPAPRLDSPKVIDQQ